MICMCKVLEGQHGRHKDRGKHSLSQKMTVYAFSFNLLLFCYVNSKLFGGPTTIFCLYSLLGNYNVNACWQKMEGKMEDNC